MSTSNSVNSRRKHLLNTGNGADVHFLVGDGDEKQLLPAHKALLGTASDAFETMFRFDAENAKFTVPATAGTAHSEEIKHIEVPDVEVGAFKTMLSFIYADELSGLDGDNAIAVLYAAKKYDVAGLVRACVDFPIPDLRNVFVAFDRARFLEEKDFSCRCLAYIDKKADALLVSKTFLQIDQKLLCEILDRDQLMISEEIAIWNAALCWADEKCRQSGKECSAENRRAMLGPALFKIRFPLIPQMDFSENIVPSGELTSDELVTIFLHYTCPDRVLSARHPLQFPTQRRSLAKLADDDAYKPEGQIRLKIEKVSEFAREDVKACRLSDTVCQLDLFGNTSNCFTKRGKMDYSEGINYVFHSKENTWGFAHFITFEKLLDPNNGWYDETNDTVMLSADVTADEPHRIE